MHPRESLVRIVRQDGRRRTAKRCLTIALCLLAFAPTFVWTGNADGAPFDRIYASRVRLVSRLPSSGNKQRVIGFDGGGSFVQGKIAIWSVGDSGVDGNGDGIYSPDGDPLGFVPGTLGRATIRRPTKGVDLQLSTTDGKNVAPVLIPDVAHNECSVWPNSVFEADAKLYFFYGSYQRLPDCHADPFTEAFGVGLARIDDPASLALESTRVGSDTTYTYTVNPLKIGTFVYLFKLSAGAVYVARVDETKVASRGFYEYWNGSGWGGETNAVPMVTLEAALVGAPRIAFNDYVGRYMMVYACNGIRDLCARTAVNPGATVSALLGGWNDRTVLFSPGLAAYGIWHTGYKDPANPQRIFITTGRFPGRLTYLTWWAVDLSPDPAPSTRTFYYGGRDLYLNGPGVTAWNYGTYDLLAPGAGLSVGTLVPGTGQSHPSSGPLGGYVGNETVDGHGAPGASTTAVWPSATKAGAIVWTAPANGTIQISGSMWLELTAGDGVMGDVFLVRGSTVRPLWSKRVAPAWKPTRERRFNLVGVPVLAGDRIVLGARKGKLPTSTPTKDLTWVDVTITLDQS